MRVPFSKICWNMTFFNISPRYEKENATYYLFQMTWCYWLFSALLCSSHLMFALWVYYWAIYKKIALNGTLTLFAEMSLSRLRPIWLLFESTSISLFDHNRMKQSVWHFDLGRDALNRFGPDLDCRLFLNRIVGSSYKRDIFPIVRTRKLGERLTKSHMQQTEREREHA